MSRAVAELEAEIRSLNADDKMGLIRALLAELDGPVEADVERAWIEEAQRRHREVVDGTVSPFRGSCLRKPSRALESMRLEFHPEAELEFIEAAAYYERQVAGLGQRFGVDVRQALDILLAHPEIGVAVDVDLRKYVLQRFPFSIYLQPVAGCAARRGPGPSKPPPRILAIESPTLKCLTNRRKMLELPASEHDVDAQAQARRRRAYLSAPVALFSTALSAQSLSWNNAKSGLPAGHDEDAGGAHAQSFISDQSARHHRG